MDKQIMCVNDTTIWHHSGDDDDHNIQYLFAGHTACGAGGWWWCYAGMWRCRMCAVLSEVIGERSEILGLAGGTAKIQNWVSLWTGLKEDTIEVTVEQC